MKIARGLPTKEIKRNSRPSFRNDDDPSSTRNLRSQVVMKTVFKSMLASGCIR